MRDQGGGDEDNLLSRYLTVAALAGRKIEELFVFWSLVAAGGLAPAPRESNLQVNSSPTAPLDPPGPPPREVQQSAEKCNTCGWGYSAPAEGICNAH